jgi:hypothetical protein
MRDAWRTFRVLAITAFLIWFGLYEMDAHRRGEDSLLVWYVVIASIAVAALIDHVWAGGVKKALTDGSDMTPSRPSDDARQHARACGASLD